MPCHTIEMSAALEIDCARHIWICLLNLSCLVTAVVNLILCCERTNKSLLSLCRNEHTFYNLHVPYFALVYLMLQSSFSIPLSGGYCLVVDKKKSLICKSLPISEILHKCWPHRHTITLARSWGLPHASCKQRFALFFLHKHPTHTRDHVWTIWKSFLYFFPCSPSLYLVHFACFPNSNSFSTFWSSGGSYVCVITYHSFGFCKLDRPQDQFNSLWTLVEMDARCFVGVSCSEG